MLKLIRRTGFFVILWDILLAYHLMKLAHLSVTVTWLAGFGLLSVHGVFFLLLHNQVKDKAYQDQKTSRQKLND